MHIESGCCAIPLSPLIQPCDSDMVQFIKTPHTARGSAAVFTYDLQRKDTDKPTEKIAVMFSVSYDFNLYSNKYAVGIVEMSKKCDYDLYSEMYSGTDEAFMRGKASGPYLIYKGKQVTIMAAMSDTYQPVIKLQVSELE